MSICCPCDVIVHPGKPEIAAGLLALPRQLAGFPEYRQAMLRDVPRHLALSQWRAREGDDLGLMLLEMWAYVLDILGFYDERIANESYLRTAILPPSLHRLIELIGYQPRPALAASVVLAAIADGKRLVTLPPRTGFRSNAFQGEPPQVFETEIEQTIHPLKNEWTLAPVREKVTGGELLLESSTAAFNIDQLVLLRLAGAGTQLGAGRVTSIETTEALDGGTYRRITIDPPPILLRRAGSMQLKFCHRHAQRQSIRLPPPPSVSKPLQSIRSPPPSHSGVRRPIRSPPSPDARMHHAIRSPLTLFTRSCQSRSRSLFCADARCTRRPLPRSE